ncbi:DUF3450 domain-containing protein [Halomonas sp. M4R5S39]|uniref:DUF3450 domain-containing protein n=1 Tax=Halomonas kalidii TaxID=3043293 RepID=UPI0024A973F4|nr:DUF3450 domain-containing protein [Halomonas kalidii]MDI5985592.1 DUF3450 domain-containing protein [Halomonas kalidii]
MTFRHPLLCGAALWWLVVAPMASAETLLEEAGQAQRAQAELQARIDAADDEMRERLEELRRLERETRRLDAENDLLAPRLARQAETLERREAALATLAETREALPALERGLVERLASWVNQDLPFLVDERRARVASLESGLADPEASAADRLDRILSAWRAELDYGREFDAWRGNLEEGGSRREVEFLRLGRVGYYYLTPDGRQGGVWQADEGRWAELDEEARREVRHGLRIARDQRAPELLRLPVSQPLQSADEPDRGERS